jgi:hypothetical protein
MMHTSTNTRLKEEFMKRYCKDFVITGGDLMKSFLGMQVIRRSSFISINVQEMLSEYKGYTSFVPSVSR